MHAPVAGLEQAIGARIRAFMRQLPPGRIFERGNWHLHTTGELHHPAPDDWTRAHGLDAGDIGGLARLSPKRACPNTSGKSIR